MSRQFEQFRHLVELIELQLEQCISRDEFAQLEELIRSDAEARRFYREYLDLHGMLHWGTALTDAPELNEQESTEPLSLDLSRVATIAHQPVPATPKPQRQKRSLSAVVALCAAAVVAAVIFLSGQADTRNELVDDSVPSAPHGPDKLDPEALIADTTGLPNDRGANGNAATRPVELPSHQDRSGSTNVAAQLPDAEGSSNDDRLVARAADSLPPNPRLESGSHSVVAFINEQIRQGWRDSDVTASPRSDDAEWIRRVTLDLVGHIPTAERVSSFLVDKRENKRELLIDELLGDEDYIHNWTTIWTNLLIGRSNPREVNRDALQKFLRDSFAENRGWNEIVADIVSAKGAAEENGATNFLIAHVNNQAVPATAITAKLFLGLQIQCTQCHNHPFNDKTQEEFWAFNSFFQQVDVKSVPVVSNPERRHVVLSDHPEGGPTFYETRNGLMKAAFPRFETHKVDDAESVNRRDELAKLMTAGEAPQMARAFVNRMWQHFFGVGFTPTVDDMGPHAVVSHPEVLDGLTREFVRSGYDVKQLMRWICRTDAYSLTSRFGESNSVDNPSIGEMPLFSRVYVKPMTVEQLFDSLLIATGAREMFGNDWASVEKRRQDWLQQFVMAWNTDENDEADLFDGTIPQALMLMNGDLIQSSLESERGTYLDRVVHSRASENDKIEAIALAALSRHPSRIEVAAVRRLLRERVARRPAGEDSGSLVRGGLEDYFWACLNSNEFILIH
ncbi:DUF1549 domain-containing protein [bacterium]|nr:DUF1549 domain-containing protein [bacterium]